METVNCVRCDFRHKDNGNCTAVGGFCTAVPAAHCPMLRAYLDTGLTPVECTNAAILIRAAFSDDLSKAERILELMQADKEGRLKIVPRAPKGAACGSCVHFDREAGTAHGFCKTQTQMRVSAEFPSGRTEPRYVTQSRLACKGYEPLEEDGR